MFLGHGVFQSGFHSRLDQRELSGSLLTPVPVLNEDTFYLMSLIKRNSPLYQDCFRQAEVALEKYPPEQERTRGIGNIAAKARAALAEVLRDQVVTCDDLEIREFLEEGRITWHDVACEFIADVFSFHDDG